MGQLTLAVGQLRLVSKLPGEANIGFAVLHLRLGFPLLHFKRGVSAYNN